MYLEITIDISSVELDAIQTVYPEVRIQWCFFHIAHAWMAKDKERFKINNMYHDSTERSKAIASLKQLMWERNAAEFNRKLQPFLIDFGSYT